MGLTKELLTNYQNEEEFLDNNRMLEEWEYAETQKPEHDYLFSTDAVDEDASEIEYTLEQNEYIKDNLLIDLEVGCKLEILKKEMEEMFSNDEINLSEVL